MEGFNTRLLRQTILANMAKSKTVMDKTDNAIKKQFDIKKEEFLEAFDEHPVTIELNNASHNPMVHSSFISKGNLFSLLGFDAGSKPAEELRGYLDHNIKLNTHNKRTKINGNKLVIEVPVTFPTLDEVSTASNNLTPLEWANGRGWVDLIQKGITGFAQFIAAALRSPKPSRSGGGIQRKDEGAEFLSGSVGPIKYVNQLLQNFKNSISGRK